MQQFPGPVSPDDVMAYVDGEAPSEIAERIASDPHWSAEARGYARAQSALRQRLYRFDCPSSQTLGEYELAMLAPAEQTRIARHVVECPHCMAEVAALRTFMATDLDMPPVHLGERVRRLVATLLPAPRGAEAGLRGAADETIRTYRVGDVTITLDVSPARRGRASLIGLVVREDGDLLPAGSHATLIGTSGTVALAEIDDLGNFAFDDVSTGSWQVEVDIGDDILLIEDFRIET